MKKIYIIGAGPMAAEYVKALKKLDVDIHVIGRNETSCVAFGKEHAVSVSVTPIEKLDLSAAIVINAVSFENLAGVNIALLNSGAKVILSEKPAGLNSTEVRELVSLKKKDNCQLFVAYNRRHFASVLKLKEILKKENILSAHFEFTEWAHVIEKLNKPKISLENWFYGNSTHIIDLFIHLAGMPTKISAYKTGKLSWHPNGSIFSGAGITNKNIPFNYEANWESAGRWGLDICTDKGKYSLRPLEKLFFIPKGTVQQQEIEITEPDAGVKPGLLSQVTSLLSNEYSQLLSIEEHLINCEKVYDIILNGH
jgi:predicted dehydrogenase